jgi:hypothetical protein
MQKSENINELALALTKAQAEMGGAVTDADNPFFKSKYADLGSIIRVIKPPFAKHGLSYSQFPITSEDRIGVETVIVHESGQFISNEFTMRVPKADPQSAGGVISYCRRYALQAVCGVPAVDSDGEEYMQVARADENNGQSNEEPETEPEDYVWPGKQKHHGKKLGEIAKKDPEYLKETLKEKFEIIKEQDPDLLKAIERVVSQMSHSTKQDFPDAQ